MVRPKRDRLKGCVEVDETYVGGTEVGVHGRETEDKSIVAVAVEEDGPGMGRIRLRRVPDVSADSLIPFVEQSVEPGSLVHTDGWGSYNGLKGKGYKHRVTNIKRSGQLAHELMPRVHRIAATGRTATRPCSRATTSSARPSSTATTGSSTRGTPK